jgi:Gas vesicle protein
MTTAEVGTRAEGTSPERQIALVDLLDRLLGAGVVLSGDVIISLAGVDLVEVRLHALVTSVRADSTLANRPARSAPVRTAPPSEPAGG